MIAVFLAGTTAICGAGWLICWVASAALAKYMTDKGYKLPSNNEMKNCCNYDRRFTTPYYKNYFRRCSNDDYVFCSTCYSRQNHF